MPMTTICRSFIVTEARELNHAFTYTDLMEGAKQHGLSYTYGTFRNNISKLLREGKLLKFPSECPARFILRDWKDRPEYERWFQNDKPPMGVRGCGGSKRVDFGGLVESLDWGELAYVHDVKVEFDSGRFGDVCSGSGWRWIVESHSWVRKFRDLEFPLAVQVYDTWRVQVSVTCSVKPISFDLEGLTRLISVLGELKGCLGWSKIPNVADWIVTSWHYGKDCKQEVSGPAFNVTFKTWCERLGRIYFKSNLNRVRAEEIQSPHKAIQNIFDSIMNRDDKV